MKTMSAPVARYQASRTYLTRALCAGTFLLSVAGLLGLAGARVNTSKSIPLGLYWTCDRPARKGEYVLLCPPQTSVFEEARRRGYLGAGFCPGGHGYMMKQIAAAEGDTVTIGAEGVRVDDSLLPLSAPLTVDLAGRSMPRLRVERYVLGASDVLLMSDVSRTSFDARYFGPVSRTQIRTVIVPVFTW